MSREILIEGNGAKLLVRVDGYADISAADESDANWLKSYVNLSSANFNLEYPCSLTTNDFKYFRDDVNNIRDKKTARFETDEEAIAVTLDMLPTGEIVVSCASNVINGIKTKVEFEFSIDQSYLGPISESLESICRDYPIR